ncbi:MAG: nuclear transport factor 2 family protein [Hominenteromicrobium sp.]
MKEKILETSRRFWKAMEHADEASMREIADANCNFVHIGITCKLDQEIEFYTSGAFQPTELIFNSQTADVFGSTAVVLTDCNYSLLLSGKETTHHFAVTEVYNCENGGCRLVSFTFTALVY